MPYHLIHHDLITVPLWGNRPGIFWLRMYQDQGRYVAVVTAVPGDPSGSVTNCISHVAYYIQRQFTIPSGQLVLYEVWPRGSPGSDDKAGVRRVGLDNGPNWEDASHAEIEALVGGRLPELPPHYELYRRVLALGGGNIEEVERDVFEAVPVTRLPPPHNPSKCEHSSRFAPIRAQHQAAGKHWRAADLEAGSMFLSTLTPDDLRKCRYHGADWKAIADESVRILETLGRRDREDYLTAAAQARLRPQDHSWLYSLFSEPIVIGGGAYNNGQHRGCALRFSGAERAAVITGTESLGEANVDWTYVGGG